MTTWLCNLDEVKGVQVDGLLKTNYSKEIRILMQENAIMKEHIAPNDIIIQVLQGEIELSYNDKTQTFKEFDMISLAAKVPHSLKANKKTMIRLSLFAQDSIDRVKQVLKS